MSSTAAMRDRARHQARRPKPEELTGTFGDGDPEAEAEDQRIAAKYAAREVAEDRKRQDLLDAAEKKGAKAERDKATKTAGDKAAAKTKRDQERATAAEAKRVQDRRARRVGKAKKHGRRVARGVAHPVRANQSLTLVGFLAGSLALVLLYDILTTVDTATGALGGIQRGLKWLASPTAVIGFASDSPTLAPKAGVRGGLALAGPGVSAPAVITSGNPTQVKEGPP